MNEIYSQMLMLGAFTLLYEIRFKKGIGVVQRVLSMGAPLLIMNSSNELSRRRDILAPYLLGDGFKEPPRESFDALDATRLLIEGAGVYAGMQHWNLGKKMLFSQQMIQQQNRYWTYMKFLQDLKRAFPHLTYGRWLMGAAGVNLVRDIYELEGMFMNWKTK